MLLALLTGQGVYAQDLPPAILAFSADLDSISLPDAEQGQTIVTLSWSTLDLTPDFLLQLQVYQVNRWQPISEQTNISLPATGSLELTVQHTLSFAPPSYRLIILDSTGQMVDERTLVIPYQIPETATPPTIVSFTSTMTTIDAASFQQGTTQIPVQWQVEGRLPNTNLRFEQVNLDGSRRSAEPPRRIRWIGSSGEGAVLPLLHPRATSIDIRLSVVDLLTNTVLDEASLEVEIVGSLSENAGGFVPGQPGPPAALFANVSPTSATYGDTITISWRMTGIQSFSATVQVGSDAPIAVVTGATRAGSATYVLPAGTYTEARFLLSGTNSSNISRNQEVVVTVR